MILFDSLCFVNIGNRTFRPIDQQEAWSSHMRQDGCVNHVLIMQYIQSSISNACPHCHLTFHPSQPPIPALPAGSISLYRFRATKGKDISIFNVSPNNRHLLTWLWLTKLNHGKTCNQTPVYREFRDATPWMYGEVVEVPYNGSPALTLVTISFMSSSCSRLFSVKP